MSKRSAGILLFQHKPELEFFLVHPGGPYWAKKDEGSWSIPKGLYEDGEDPEQAARREFAEETSRAITEELLLLGDFKQPSGKNIRAWAAEGDFDISKFKSNLFSMEWPPHSGKMAEFPEADNAAWLSPGIALRKILKGQRPIILALLNHVGASVPPVETDLAPQDKSSDQGSLF